MATLHNLKPEKVIKAFERAGWVNKGQRESHVKLVKPDKCKWVPLLFFYVYKRRLNQTSLQKQDGSKGLKLIGKIDNFFYF